MKVRILVLNYNGEDILAETLPTILKAVSRCYYPCAVTMIDNESTDRSVELVRERFPSVEIVRRPNRILCSYNDVCKNVTEDIVVLLNNDLKVHPDFFNPILKPFENYPDLFLVAPKCMDFVGSRVMGSVCRARFTGGLLRVTDWPGADVDSERSQETLAAGAAGAYDRRKFNALGGYDDIYLPGTLEDVDLCLRAWRSGYRCIYAPQSVVYHMGQRSFHRRFGKAKTAAINARNNFIFVWKNISDWRFRLQHILLLPPRLFYHILRGQAYWVSAFFEALGRLPEIKKRQLSATVFKWSDREIIARFDGQNTVMRTEIAFAQPIVCRNPVERFLMWRKFLKNWPVRVLERFGFVRGEVKYKLRNGLTLLMRGGPADSDALILWDVYVNRPYARTPFGIKSGDVVVDVGAHVGLFSTWAARQAQAVRVVSYEAHPVNFSYLKKNVEANGLSGVHVYNRAVAGRPGKVRLYVHEEGHGGNSLYRERVKQSDEKYFEVESTTLDELIREHAFSQIDLLKLDCEGAEYDILMNASPVTLKKVKKIAMEYHAVPGVTLDELKTRLSVNGFEFQHLEDQSVLYAWRNGGSA